MLTMFVAQPGDAAVRHAGENNRSVCAKINRLLQRGGNARIGSVSVNQHRHFSRSEKERFAALLTLFSDTTSPSGIPIV